MSKHEWGARDIAALRRLRKRFLSDATAALDIGASAISVSRWLSGNSPRYPEAVRAVLLDRGCYSVRRAKA